MNIHYIVFYISCLIWILPLFKQKYTPYFGYFLVLALSDPVGMVLYTLVKFHTTYYSLLSIVIQLGFLLQQRNRINSLVLGVLSTILILLFFHERMQLYYCASIVFILIILTLSLELYKYIKKNEINIFLSLLIFYNVINLFKVLALALSFEQGAISFSMGYSIQILFGISFFFVNINTRNFKLHLR